MHLALTIAELLPLIFEEIKRTRFSSDPDLRSLAAVARTCTGFRDPALDILWRRQVTLKNFFSCFPIDAQASVYKKGGVGVVTGVVSSTVSFSLISIPIYHSGYPKTNDRDRLGTSTSVFSSG
jgi:hypothetical protein